MLRRPSTTSTTSTTSTSSTSSTSIASTTSTTVPTGPADACTAAKLRATARYERRLLACHAGATRKGDASGFTTGVSRAETRFAVAFAKAGSCSGEQATCGCLAAACADVVRAEPPGTVPDRCVAAALVAAARWTEGSASV